MIKDVIITITGLQFVVEDDSQEPEAMEVITSGTYYMKNGKHYILYDEIIEGFSEVTKNIIKIGSDTIDISKKGITNVQMNFDKNKKNMTCYHTPYGEIMMGIEAKQIDIMETEELIRADIKYDLELNYEHIAQCDISIKIQPKGNANLKLENDK